ncbi:MAG: TonB-dependent receptor, partial [Gammaproteobacteria bacterium]|nr:TonB-dependent receptor [Gammaproteobacteria bacterium]
LYLQEEDGMGQRPNIGIRGSGSDRSSRIALLEDGVLIAPAPYAAPSAYYFPTAKRMQSIEVVKGPAAIEVGPRTTGGAINMRSTPLPNEFSGYLSAMAGTDNATDILARIGGKTGAFGFQLETVQQNFDGFKNLYINDSKQNTGFNTQDYLIKLGLESDRSSRLYQAAVLKLGKTKHDGNETYLGLTEEDFAKNPYDRYTGSQLDNIKTDHDQIQLTYLLEDRDGSWDFSTTIYNNEFERNWFKLAKVNGIGITNILNDPNTYATEMSYLKGADSGDNALTNRNNARSYYSRGIQAQLGNNFDWSSVSLRSVLGVRLHKDEEDRLQDDDKFKMQNGVMVMTSDGAPGSATNRVSDAKANSIFWSGDIEFGKWTLEPGIRYEKIKMTRNDYSTSDADRVNGPTKVRESKIDVVIPGFGALYALNENWSLLGGIYKGYNPPAPGSESDAETSVNYEAGTRYQQGVKNLSAIVFYNNYDNIVGTVTESTGGGGEIGDQYDGGKAKVAGLELTSGYTANDSGTINFPLLLTYTWTPVADFRNSFESDYDPWGDVKTGDELPYIPEHLLQVSAGAVGSSWESFLNVNYTGELRTEAGQGTIPNNEKVGSYVVVDLAGKYFFKENIAVVARVDNLLDNNYLTSRSPSGLRPGKPRQVFAGIQISF